METMYEELSIGTIKGKRPKVKALRHALQSAIDGAPFYYGRMRLAEDTAWCLWDSQWEDGRKHGDDDDPAFPFEDASDTRVRLVERYLHEANMICDQAFLRGDMRFGPMEGGDVDLAARCTVLLKALLSTQMAPEIHRERRLTRRWRNLYGQSMTGIDWNRDTRYVLEDMSLKTLIEAFGYAPALQQLNVDYADPRQLMMALQNLSMPAQFREQLGNAADLLINPERTKELIQTMQAIFPTAHPGYLRQAAKEFQRTGKAKMPMKYVLRDQPRWKALRMFDHAFCPVNTLDPATAEWIAIRETLTEAQMLGRAKDENWKQSFVDAVEGSRGQSAVAEMQAWRSQRRRMRASGTESWDRPHEDVRDRYEVFHMTYEAVDESGCPALYTTVLQLNEATEGNTAGSEEEQYGKHEMLDYAHGRLPFVGHVMNQTSETFLDNVGIPYLLYTYQSEVKTLRDARIDATSLSISPPVVRHARDMDTALFLAPNAEIEERIPNSTRFLTPPVDRNYQAVELERTIYEDAGNLMGAMDATVPPPRVELKVGAVAEKYLEEMQECGRMTWSLVQQFFPAQRVDRISPGLGEKWGELQERSAILQQWDLRLIFDARELDTQFRIKKLELLEAVTKSDVFGVIDQHKRIELELRIIDPHWADILVQDKESAANKEIEAAMIDIALILTGQEPVRKEQGINFALRAQVLERSREELPVVQMATQQNEAIAQVYDSHLQHLIFMREQFSTRKQEGRQGSKLVFPKAV